LLFWLAQPLLVLSAQYWLKFFTSRLQLLELLLWLELMVGEKQLWAQPVVT
jgi:hypothetical protein